MPSYSLKPKELPISDETAQAQISQLLEFYDYDLDAQSEPLKTQMTGYLDSIFRAIRLGQITIGDDGKVTQTPTTKGASVLEYKEFKGDAKLELDKVPTGQNSKKIFALMGYLAGVDSSAFAQLNAKDNALVEALALFFLSK